MKYSFFIYHELIINKYVLKYDNEYYAKKVLLTKYNILGRKCYELII